MKRVKFLLLQLSFLIYIFCAVDALADGDHPPFPSPPENLENDYCSFKSTDYVGGWAALDDTGAIRYLFEIVHSKSAVGLKLLFKQYELVTSNTSEARPLKPALIAQGMGFLSDDNLSQVTGTMTKISESVFSYKLYLDQSCNPVNDERQIAVRMKFENQVTQKVYVKKYSFEKVTKAYIFNFTE